MTNADQSGATSTMDRQADVPKPGRFDPETEARLDGIDRDATKHVEDNRPAKTRNGYAADWRAWEAFCAETNLPPLAVRSGTLVLFTEWCWIQPGYKPGLFLAPSTIDRRLAGVVVTGRRQHKLQLAVRTAAVIIRRMDGPTSTTACAVTGSGPGSLVGAP